MYCGDCLIKLAEHLNDTVGENFHSTLKSNGLPALSRIEKYHWFIDIDEIGDSFDCEQLFTEVMLIAIQARIKRLVFKGFVDTGV